MPVLAARAIGKPSSMARTRAIRKCCCGPAQGPNQESSVMLTSQPGRGSRRIDNGMRKDHLVTDQRRHRRRGAGIQHMRMIAGVKAGTHRELAECRCDSEYWRRADIRRTAPDGTCRRSAAARRRPEQIKAVIGGDAALSSRTTRSEPVIKVWPRAVSSAIWSSAPGERATGKPVAASGQMMWVGISGRGRLNGELNKRCQLRSIRRRTYFSACGISGCTSLQRYTRHVAHGCGGQAIHAIAPQHGEQQQHRRGQRASAATPAPPATRPAGW